MEQKKISRIFGLPCDYFAMGCSIILGANVILFNGIYCEAQQETITESVESADILVMEPHSMTVEDGLNACLGPDGWSDKYLKALYDEKNGIYDDGEQYLRLFFGDGSQGYGYIEVYCGDIPDPESMIEEWRETIENLGINLADEYTVENVDSEEDKCTAIYNFYVQYDGIKICPASYVIGALGSEIYYSGQQVKVCVYDYGYAIEVSAIADVISQKAVSRPRTFLTDEEIEEVIYAQIQSTGIEVGTDIIIEEDSLDFEPVYLMVDKGDNKQQTIWDIGILAKEEGVSRDGIPVRITAFVDGTYPYCFYSIIESDSNSASQGAVTGN